MNIDNDTLNIILGILALISGLWALRSQLKSFQAENSSDIKERTKMCADISNLQEKVDDLHTMVTSLESERHEIRSLTDRVDSIYRELDKKIDNLISIILGSSN